MSGALQKAYEQQITKVWAELATNAIVDVLQQGPATGMASAGVIASEYATAGYMLSVA